MSDRVARESESETIKREGLTTMTSIGAVQIEWDDPGRIADAKIQEGENSSLRSTPRSSDPFFFLHRALLLRSMESSDRVSTHGPGLSR